MIIHIEEEIKNEISEEVINCFGAMLDSFRNNGFEVSSSSELGKDFEVNLRPKRIVIETDSEITLTKSGESSTEKNFEISIKSGLYGLVLMAMEVVDQEAEFGHFENVGVSAVEAQYNIRKIPFEDVKIYSIEDVFSGEKFRFAIRGVVIRGVQGIF